MPRGVYARVKKAPRVAHGAFQAEKVEAPVPQAGARTKPTAAAIDALLALKPNECVDINRRGETIKGYVFQLHKVEPTAKFVVRPSPERENWSRVWRVE